MAAVQEESWWDCQPIEFCINLCQIVLPDSQYSVKDGGWGQVWQYRIILENKTKEKVGLIP